MKPLLEKGEDKNGKENEDFFQTIALFTIQTRLEEICIWINFEAPYQCIRHNKI